MGKRPDDGTTCAGKGAMGGGGLRAPSKLRPTRWRDPGVCPTKGLCYNLPEPDVGADDGVSVDQRMPQQGAGGWWELGAGTDDGARNVWVWWSVRMSNLAGDYLLFMVDWYYEGLNNFG